MRSGQECTLWRKSLAVRTESGGGPGWRALTGWSGKRRAEGPKSGATMADEGPDFHPNVVRSSHRVLSCCTF